MKLTRMIIIMSMAIAAKMFRTGPDESFAFDKTFPNNGYTWKFEVIQNEEGLLDKLDMHEPNVPLRKWTIWRGMVDPGSIYSTSNLQIGPRGCVPT